MSLELDDALQHSFFLCLLFIQTCWMCLFQVKYKEKYEKEKGKPMLDFETPTYVTAKEAQHMQSQVNVWAKGDCRCRLPLRLSYTLKSFLVSVVLFFAKKIHNVPGVCQKTFYSASKNH